MTLSLKSALQDVMAGWETDLPPAWRDALGPLCSGIDDVDESLPFELWEPIFPVRRGRHFPGQPAGAHLLRAFDGLAPVDVKCLVLGQDPYPEPGFATGRAFEAGNVTCWADLDKMWSKSVRAFMQLIAASRTSDASLASGFAAWPRVRGLLMDPASGFESPAAIADRWVASGVLLLNSSLTLSRFTVSMDPHQLRGHLPFWRPLILRTIDYLRRRAAPLVIVSFGAAAAQAVRSAGLDDGEHGSVKVILREHPAHADALLSKDNPLALCNRFLEARGASPVAW